MDAHGSASTRSAPKRRNEGAGPRVLYFGTYERSYPRNAQVIAALRRAGARVAERHVSVWDTREHKWSAGAGAALRLAAAQLHLLRKPRGSFDALIVGYPGHADVAAARRVAGDRPLIFNPLVSLWDTLVEDRGRFSAQSAAARALRALDRFSLRIPDAVVADTRANAEHLTRLANLEPGRVEVCFVGAEERLFGPPWTPEEPPLFVGKLIPLHGVETVLAAAARLPSQPVRLVGSGQLEPALERRSRNVEWLPWLPYERLPEALRHATCALGIFGSSRKAARVIPNKVFQALACGTPVITADTPAARELLVHEESALLVPPADAAALADAIERLAGDAELRQRLSLGGLTAFRERASEAVLGARWRALVERLL